MDNNPQTAGPEAETPEAAGKKNAVDTAFTIVQTETLAVYHSPDDRAFLLTMDGDRFIFLPVGSRQFRRWLRRKLRKITKKAANSNQLDELGAELEAYIFEQGSAGRPFLRYGRDSAGNIIVNRNPAAGELVKITPQGFSPSTVLDSCSNVDNVASDGQPGSGEAFFPVVAEGQGVIPEPAKQTEAIARWRELWPNIPDNDFLLLIVWIVQSMIPEGPFPIAVLIAPQGAGKTSLTAEIRRIVDPHTVKAIRPPRENRDYFSAASIQWLLAVDNLSRLTTDLSDLFCITSTGGGLIERQLYTNSGVSVRGDTRRPQVLTGISEFLKNGDVIERSLFVTLERIDGESRRREETLRRQFEEILPGLIHFFYGLVSEVLNMPTPYVENPLRMADFCGVGETVARSLGYEAGAFMEIYTANQRQARVTVIEASPIGKALRLYIENEIPFGSVNIQMSALLDRLAELDPEGARSKYWPGNARALSTALSRVAPAFMDDNVLIEKHRTAEGVQVCIQKQ